MRNRIAIGILALCLSVVVGVGAQTPVPTDTPGVSLTFPPPVYVVGGTVDLVGTVQVTNLVNYFVAYRPLNDDFTPRDGEDTAWFPATLPSRAPVQNGLIGLWDTTTAPDGLYALRLTVNVEPSETLFDVVTPIRIDNSEAAQLPVLLDEDEAINNALLSLTATAEAKGSGVAVVGGTTATPNPFLQATEIPLTPLNDGPLTAEVVVVANLRQGDSTLFAIKQGLNPGDVLDVLGQSARGNNWLLVVTEDGERGWVAPSVVQLNGSILDAPPINPPVPPVTPTPTAPPIPELPDALVTSVRVDRTIKQGEAFQIIVGIQNAGRQFLPESMLFCNVEPLNVEVAILAGNLQVGASTNVALPLRLDSGGGQDVRIICKLDMNNEIDEINENNNLNSANVFLNNP
jgi:hypothetical protein